VLEQAALRQAGLASIYRRDLRKFRRPIGSSGQKIGSQVKELIRWIYK
jgi:hypothetical protein